MAQPIAVRPAMAKAVASPMAKPACCAPSAGASSENKCATRPICANSPRAMPADSARNLRFRQSSAPGSGLAAGDVSDVGRVPGASPSGVSPICSGVRENTWSARTHIVRATTRPIAAAAVAKPSMPIAATHSGENTTPPMLPPL